VRGGSDEQPWEVWWVQFSPQVGGEQAGDRPTIVVGSPLACRIPNDLVTVVPVTSRNRNLVWQPPVVIGDRPSYAMRDQIKTISAQRFRKRRDDVQVTATEIDAIQHALRMMIDI
jgi:mRNA interferase MazF